MQTGADYLQLVREKFAAAVVKVRNERELDWNYGIPCYNFPGFSLFIL